MCGMKKEFTSQDLAEAFAEHRARLLSLVEKRLNPILLKRLSHEDVMQEVYLAAVKRLTYFAQNEDVSFNTFADYLMACGFGFTINLLPAAGCSSIKSTIKEIHV